MGLEEGALLRHVVALLFKRDRFRVQLLLLERVDIVWHVLLTRGVVPGQTVREFRQMRCLRRLNTLANLGEEAGLVAAERIGRDGPTSLAAS